MRVDGQPAKLASRPHVHVDAGDVMVIPAAEARPAPCEETLGNNTSHALSDQARTPAQL